MSGRLTGARPAETPHLVHGPRDGRFSRLWRASHPPAHPAVVVTVVFKVASQKVPCRERMADAKRVGAWRAGGFDQSYRFAPHLAPGRGVAGGRNRVLVWSDPM